MSVPAIGPIISSTMAATIGAGDVFTKSRDFAVWLGVVREQTSIGDLSLRVARSEIGSTFHITTIDADKRQAVRRLSNLRDHSCHVETNPIGTPMHPADLRPNVLAHFDFR